MARSALNLSPEIDKEINEIREIINSLPKTANGNRYGINSALRVRILRLKKDSGMRGAEFARAVGIGFSTLGKWQGVLPAKNKNKNPSFRRARVKPDESQSRVGLSDCLVIVEGPMGLKFKLDESQLAGLVRRLA